MPLTNQEWRELRHALKHERNRLERANLIMDALDRMQDGFEDLPPPARNAIYRRKGFLFRMATTAVLQARV